MDRREQLHELHLALEGVVDQFTRAQRTSTTGTHGIDGLNARIDALFAELVNLRNQVRDELLKELARPPDPPTIRIRK